MTEMEDIVRRMVEAAGHTTQSLGVGRVLGQIYAYLYFSPEAQTLDDLTKALGISKGSASMGVRQLEQWGGVEKIWVKGDRKDYYRARDRFGKLLKNAMLELVGKRIQSSVKLMQEVEEDIASKESSAEKLTDEDRFIRQKLAALKKFQNKALGLWEKDILKMFVS